MKFRLLRENYSEFKFPLSQIGSILGAKAGDDLSIEDGAKGLNIAIRGHAIKSFLTEEAHGKGTISKAEIAQASLDYGLTQEEATAHAEKVAPVRAPTYTVHIVMSGSP